MIQQNQYMNYRDKAQIIYFNLDKKKEEKINLAMKYLIITKIKKLVYRINL